VDGNRLERLTRPTAVVLWLVVAATVVVGRSGSPRFPYWAACWSIGFVACLATSLSRVGRAWALPAIAVQGVMVGAMTALLGNGFEGLLLVPIALELRFRLRPLAAALGALAITVLFAAGVFFHMNAWSACMLALPYAAIQVLVLAASIAFERENALRTELASAHQELQALGPVLEEGSRNAERVRLSRELHDTTGHRLTALALQLEVALHAAEGAVRSRIEIAQRVVRELIDDMHRIVASTDLTDSEGLAAALRELARNFPRPLVHLSLPERLRVLDAERAHVLLRCSQEILTNSARHSGAQNLWLEITQGDTALHLRARDDGTVTSGLRAGAGLRGMQGRFEGLGGTLRYESAPQGGLEILASLPNQPA
jgi:signal transduction histidine kinase